MNILFDFISLQEYHNGGEEYTRKILNDIIINKDVNIFGLYDSKLRFLDNDYEIYSKQLYFIDINKYHINEIINKYDISLFYIGIAQRFLKYNLDNINCKSICTIHDIGDIEILSNGIIYSLKPDWKNTLICIFDRLFPYSRYASKKRILRKYSNLISFISKNNVEIITVSEYSKNSLNYFFPILRKKNIKVYYPPVKNYNETNKISNEIIKSLINNKMKYLLFLNANRNNKNYYLLEKCYKEIIDLYPDLYLVVTNYEKKINNNKILSVKYVSNSDMEKLYKNAWALIYPSFSEGFGYPPIEAMKYSTPIVCSNVCSIPEIVGEAGLYFSPFYENDLFYKIKCLFENYASYKKKLYDHYVIIKNRQENDYKLLLNKIIEK